MNGLPPTARLIGIGWYFAICIVIGIVGGVFLDQAAGTTPLLTIIGLLLGLFLAFYGGYHLLMDTLMTKRSDSDEEDNA